MTIRTRFAPRPTGYLHIGSVRTELCCCLYVRHHDGEFLLRIEDTDRERSTQAAVDAEADQPPVFQSQRFDGNREVERQLLEEGRAYHCYYTREEQGIADTWRP